LISRHIELLLDYCARFNERQFITRCEANKIILHKIHSLLNGYILSGRLESGAMPTEEYCADALHLSPCYFRDLLKFETGKSMHEYFQLMRLDMAKKMLRNKDYTVGMTARKLGYANSQHFTCLFKKITGMTPTEYKYAQN
jgi:AraC-like DNA-binding protein